MTPEQRAYIDSRRRQIHYWPWMAAVLVLLVVAGYGWLWQNAQVNLNPQLVVEQFGARVMTDEELILLAARGTLALAACGLFILLLVVTVSVALWNERRLIHLLDDLDGGNGLAAPDEGGIRPDAATGPETVAPDEAVQVGDDERGPRAAVMAGEGPAAGDPEGDKAGDAADGPEGVAPATVDAGLPR